MYDITRITSSSQVKNVPEDLHEELAEIVARSERAGQVEELLRGQVLIAPHLISTEVLSVLRGWLARSLVDHIGAARAVRNLVTAPIRRFATSSLIDEMWSIRHNLTTYDAAYVMLARRTGAALLTLDKRLMHAPALRVPLLTIRDVRDPYINSQSQGA